ncbi:hypothetical protein [Listeria booriae]|uniref:hypothetical protein n=1 Tax=Listeria booriae TaxID=1552123 RepID=UPI0016267685|nr:hypothetical protein [Listeria booriae]MBC2173894.1 hypothetical protein [Listeria booriae]
MSKSILTKEIEKALIDELYVGGYFACNYAWKLFVPVLFDLWLSLCIRSKWIWLIQFLNLW